MIFLNLKGKTGIGIILYFILATSDILSQILDLPGWWSINMWLIIIILSIIGYFVGGVLFYSGYKDEKQKEKREKEEKTKQDKKEERKYRPDIEFNIIKYELDEIWDYLVNSELHIKINNPDFIDKILSIKNVHDGKTVELDLENNDTDNYIYNAQVSFPDKGEYTVMVSSKSKEGYKYCTQIKIKHVKMKQCLNNIGELLKALKDYLLKKKRNGYL